MSDGDGPYDYCRLYVDGAGSAQEVERCLLDTGHYRLVDRSLTAEGVSIAVRRNKNVRDDDFPEWLFWGVTIEVDRDEGVSDAAMVTLVRQLAANLAAIPARVKVVADFADDL